MTVASAQPQLPPGLEQLESVWLSGPDGLHQSFLEQARAVGHPAAGQVAAAAFLIHRALAIHDLGGEVPPAAVLLQGDLCLARACRLLADTGDQRLQAAFALVIETAAAAGAQAPWPAPERDQAVAGWLASALPPPPEPPGVPTLNGHRPTVPLFAGSQSKVDIDHLRGLVEDRLFELIQTDHPAVRLPMERLVRAGGKRLRPILVMLGACLGTRPDLGNTATLAAAIEFIHVASLVHDDYVDESRLRRGQATVSAAEGPLRAIAVGDYYFAKATRLIAELGHPAVTSTVARALEQVCLSQIDDYAFRGSYPGDRESYLRVVRGKTAALIAASCVSGSQLAGAPAAVIEALASYGDRVGVAFQMVDDLVDYSEASGKPLGQDIRERVVSLPLIYASESDRFGAEVRRLLADDDPGDARIHQLLALIEGSGAFDRVGAEARELIEGAVGALRAACPDRRRRPVVEVLSRLAGQAVNRVA